MIYYSIKFSTTKNLNKNKHVLLLISGVREFKLTLDFPSKPTEKLQKDFFKDWLNLV